MQDSLVFKMKTPYRQLLLGRGNSPVLSSVAALLVFLVIMPGLSFAHWENHPVWQSSGTTENHPVWQNAGSWENHPVWASSGGWENHPGWENSGAWENHPSWESSGSWENHPNWESSGSWENHPVWQDGGSWQNNPSWESSGEWQPGGGHWEVEDGWYYDDFWGTWVWGENWTWVEESQWVDTSHWVDNWEWVDNSHWDDNWEWIDTSHWADNWEWTDTSHWVDNWEWTDTSHWVDNWVYVDTSHWVDNWIYADTSHWVDNWVYVDTSHWVDNMVWVDDPVNRAPATSLSGPAALAPGESGYFSATANDADGNLTRWRMYLSGNPNPQWTSLGGGSASTGLSYSFNSPGTYTWVVDAEDSNGASSSSSLTVTVGNSNQPPTASIGGPQSLGQGAAATFTASANDSDANLYRWRFHFSDNPNPQWTYVSGGSASTSINWTFTAPGTYTWVVDVEDTSGASYSSSKTVTVNAVAAPLAAPVVTLYPLSQLFGNSVKTYVKAGETQAFNVIAHCPDGLNEVGLELCDASGVPLANVGLNNVSGTEAYQRFVWTAPLTLGVCYFRGYAWNADRSQLTRGAVVAITVKSFDVESYALAQMNGYTTVPGDGITFSCTISAPDQNGVVVMIIYEHGDYGVGLLRQESINVNTGEVLSRYDGVSQVDLNANPYEAWLPGGADDPFANWDPDTAFDTQTEQEMQDEFIDSLPPQIQAGVAASLAAHHVVQLRFSDGSSFLMVPDGVPAGGSIVNGKYVFRDPIVPNHNRYVDLAPPTVADDNTEGIVRMARYVVNGNDPETFDWAGYFQWLRDHQVSAADAASATAFVIGSNGFGAESLGASFLGRLFGSSPPTGALGAHETQNVFPFNQTTNNSCGVAVARNIIAIFNHGACAESETAVAQRMADIIKESLAEFKESTAEEQRDGHHGVLSTLLQFNAALNKPYNIRVEQDGTPGVSAFNGLDAFKALMQAAANNGTVFIAKTKLSGDILTEYPTLSPNHVVVLRPYLDNGTLKIDEIDSGRAENGRAKVTPYNLNNPADLLKAAKIPDGIINASDQLHPGEPQSGKILPVYGPPP